MKKILGVTGGVGSGKSTVLNHLQEAYGARIIQADLVARELMEPGGASYLAVTKAFGPEILLADGTIDRMMLSNIIFKDDEKRVLLNSLTHPLVKAEVSRRIREASEDPVVYEAALPVEAYMQELCDEVWFIHVPPEIRIIRLMASRGYSREKCLAIMATQPTDEEFTALSQRVIENGGTEEETRATVDGILKELGYER